MWIAMLGSLVHQVGQQTIDIGRQSGGSQCGELGCRVTLQLLQQAATKIGGFAA